MIKILAALFFSDFESRSNNNFLAKFQVKIRMIRPLILNVKLRFALPPLLDSRSGCEPHKDLELVGERGM